MSMHTRQVVLDTETTGLEPAVHRIIEIGCIEILDRRQTGNNYHQYIHPDRLIDGEASAVHGITNEFLENKPRFADVADELIQYLSGAEVIIHNAPFDVGFLDAELARLPAASKMSDFCQITDTLTMARNKHPGQRNSLDALCTRYDVNNARRTKHGALLDAELLALVYLAMTGGQKSLGLSLRGEEENANLGIRRLPQNRPTLSIAQADAEELMAHNHCLEKISKFSGRQIIW